tara:strand:+ start:1846 stop:1947 length:102 start_codon:yes stop_codon:yes gene_type:complete
MSIMFIVGFLGGIATTMMMYVIIIDHLHRGKEE